MNMTHDDVEKIIHRTVIKLFDRNESMAVRCECGSENDYVKKSFRMNGIIVRERRCEDCGKSYLTTEYRRS